MSEEDGGTRVLLVDDDGELCELVSEYMAARGFEVEIVGDGERGLAQAQSDEYDLMILDVMLPGLDGFEVLRRLRGGSGNAARLPVVMLTAHGDEVDRIVGLELGADDYLPKPFNPRELLARMHAILRRVGSEAEAAVEASTEFLAEDDDLICVEGVEMNVGAREVCCCGEVMELTATEFDLLHVLLCNAGRVVERDHLAREGLGRRLLPLDRSLDIHISKLRKKLGHERIKTIRGMGYLFAKNH